MQLASTVVILAFDGLFGRFSDVSTDLVGLELVGKQLWRVTGAPASNVRSRVYRDVCKKCSQENHEKDIVSTSPDHIRHLYEATVIYSF
jgi:hypothetical protein